jgi:hypothetical protein
MTVMCGIKNRFSERKDQMNAERGKQKIASLLAKEQKVIL